jgi:uncharacterized protein (DUF2147 family)
MKHDMKKRIQRHQLLLLLIALFSFSTISIGMIPNAASEDSILGEWMTENNLGKIHIFKNSDNTFSGKVIWSSQANDSAGNPRLDTKNPNPALRSQPIVGNTLVLMNLVYNHSDDNWEGKVYQPRFGRVADAVVTLKSPNTLIIKGSIGFYSQTQRWTRAQ